MNLGDVPSSSKCAADELDRRPVIAVQLSNPRSMIHAVLPTETATLACAIEASLHSLWFL